MAHGPGVKERNRGMVFRMTEIAENENPREYASQAVEDLRHLLLAGGQAERDPRREHFYNLEGDNSAYYIHISPITGNVILLAKWSRQPSDCYIAIGAYGRVDDPWNVGFPAPLHLVNLLFFCILQDTDLPVYSSNRPGDSICPESCANLGFLPGRFAVYFRVRSRLGVPSS